MTRRLAHALAARYRVLQEELHNPAEAERRTFAELLANSETSADGLSTLYEEFLTACAPDRRRSHGVYYTPAAVVQAQVRLVDDLLRSRLGRADGLGDDGVFIVDPTTGSGAYPLAILELAGDVRQRMRLFEPMPGAAAIARTFGLQVDEQDALTTQLVVDAPVVVCLGNPPYRRRASDPAARTSLDGFTKGGAGIHRKNLYNDYVYFWRWALRVAFEARPGVAIVCLVTAASYLRGPAFDGFRQTLRRILDELWLIDLEGDRLAARASDNVFPIRTPVAIALGVRYAAPVPETPAVVWYSRLQGGRDDKLAALERINGIADVQWRPTSSPWSASFLAEPHTEYSRWPLLTELFPWQISGAQLKRTWPIGPTPDVLRRRWQRLLELPPQERLPAFGPTRDRDLNCTPADLLDPNRRLTPLRGLLEGAACLEPVRYAYRSFDRQWVLPDARLGDFMRPWLWRIAGPRQTFLTSLLTNVLGSGPAAVATAYVPDLDHFRGSFGARAVIPLWHDRAATQPNVALEWLSRLSERYGFEVGAEALLAYCYALLATRSYVERFEDELRVPGPRIPLTPRSQLFQRAVELGRELLAVQTYREVRIGNARCTCPVGEPYPLNFGYDALAETLRVGDGRFAPVARDVWEYAVSGYRVVAGWLRRRVTKGGRSPLDAIRPERWESGLSEELLQLVWLIEATLALEPSLAALLGDVTLSTSASPRAGIR